MMIEKKKKEEKRKAGEKKIEHREAQSKTILA